MARTDLWTREQMILVLNLYKVREVKTRVNQNVFRKIVLANYNGKCALTGIDISELLVACHIIPWSENEQERLNPENGICLSSLYDKAFDKGLIIYRRERCYGIGFLVG